MKAVMVGHHGGRVGVRQRAVADGLARHGIEVAWVRGPRSLVGRNRMGNCFCVCWGWRRGSDIRSLGYDVLIGELGYIGDRSHWTSLGWNGLNGAADFCLTGATPPERFCRHFRLTPWKSGGDYVLVTQQVPGDSSLGGRKLKGWYRRVAAEAEAAYGLPVRFRPHPRAIERGLWVAHDPELRGLHLVPDVTAPILADLERAAVLVTFNSNSAVDAVLAGVPAVTFDPGAMAWPVTGHALGDLRRPDREDWANRVSWCQWSIEELAAGVWWERMKVALQ